MNGNDRGPCPPMHSNWRTRLKDRFYHSHSARFWPECVAVDSMSRDELLDLQYRRLTDLVNHVVRSVPFYQRWAKESGFQVGDTVSLADLPVVSKQDYRRDPEDFQSRQFARKEMIFRSSSGTTGEAFKVRLHRIPWDYSHCCLGRSLARHGIRFGDRRIYLWACRWQYTLTRRRDMLKRLRHASRDALRDWLNVSKFINAYDLSDANLSKAVRYIESFRPTYLHGGVSTLYFVARYLLDSGKPLRDGLLKGVVTETEKLYDFQKQALREAFGCEPLENYGSNEFGSIAAVDPEGYLRINEDAYVIERAANGEAIVTGLMSHAYPFLRYRLGDLIEFEDQVPPNLPYAVLKAVVGRTYDAFPLPDGTTVLGLLFAGTIEPHHDAIERFQFHQTALDRIELRLVMRTELEDARRQKILDSLRTIVGDDVHVEIQLVDDIPPAPSGKFRWVISDVAKVPTHDLREVQTVIDGC